MTSCNYGVVCTCCDCVGGAVACYETFREDEEEVAGGFGVGEGDGLLCCGVGTVGAFDAEDEGVEIGVYSRLKELGYTNAISCKVSESAKGLKDITGQQEFANMRAYLHWKVREWLNPKNDYNAALLKNEKLLQEATEIKRKFQSDGKIIIEPKDDIKNRLGRSPDYFDALANTFYPVKTPIDLSHFVRFR